MIFATKIATGRTSRKRLFPQCTVRMWRTHDGRPATGSNSCRRRCSLRLHFHHFSIAWPYNGV